MPSLHTTSVYALLLGFPDAKQLATSNLTHLKPLLNGAFKGHYNRDKAIELSDATRKSISAPMSAKSLELKYTI